MTKMFPEVVLVSLLSLVLVYSAAGLECRIYVSSSDGINNTSCWTGGVQTPCATIDLAIQGTAALQYNCSSGILINLSPGTYTLDTTSLLEQQVLRNNVSIIGMRDGSRYEEVSITCLHVSSSSYNWLKYIVFECVSLYNCNNVPVTCTEPSFDLTTHNEPVLRNEACPSFKLDLDVNVNDYYDLSCYDYYVNGNCQCDYLSFGANIIDTCTGKKLGWTYNLEVCISIGFKPQGCHSISSNGYNDIYQVEKCFNDYIDADTLEVTIYAQTFFYNMNANKTVSVTVRCFDSIFDNGTCTDISIKPCHNAYDISCINVFENYNCYCENAFNCDNDNYCYDNITEQNLLNCKSKGVPFHNTYTCVECDSYSLLVFIVIELLPITLMVLLIIIFNIQLTNGSINGVVFYSHIIGIVCSTHFYNAFCANQFMVDPKLSEIPCNIFILDFTPFIYNYSLCISPNTPPLGVISFWYVIGFYPLLLLLLLYVWITLYDKGYKCVVFITRPFHRCMARFWSMTGIEPSFTHSIASIYILCFTQLATTSFKILSFNQIATSSSNDIKFFNDLKQDYFKGVHGAAGFFAILVLLFLIVLPTLYILLYPFKWFHKLLDCLHLRKQLLISLADVFTGPYKNGTENTYDYRFMAGLYLLARIIILSQFIYGFYSMISIIISIGCCSFLLAVIALIFRPFQRNIHNFTEFFLIIAITALEAETTISYSLNIALLVINVPLFGIIIPGYIIYQVFKMIKACLLYHKRNNPVVIRDQEEDYQPLVGNDDADWIADRMENPQEYDEQHVPGRMDESLRSVDHQPITIVTAATYGSINEATNN